jgi:hypothetical protein
MVRRISRAMPMLVVESGRVMPVRCSMASELTNAR